MASIVSQATARIAQKIAARSATRSMSSSAKPPPQKFAEQIMPESQKRMEKRKNFRERGGQGGKTRENMGQLSRNCHTFIHK